MKLLICFRSQLETTQGFVSTWKLFDIEQSIPNTHSTVQYSTVLYSKSKKPAAFGRNTGRVSPGLSRLGRKARKIYKSSSRPSLNISTLSELRLFVLYMSAMSEMRLFVL